jgi:hypothetical protein
LPPQNPRRALQRNTPKDRHSPPFYCFLSDPAAFEPTTRTRVRGSARC